MQAGLVSAKEIPRNDTKERILMDSNDSEMRDLKTACRLRYFERPRRRDDVRLRVLPKVRLVFSTLVERFGETEVSDCGGVISLIVVAACLGWAGVAERTATAGDRGGANSEDSRVRPAIVTAGLGGVVPGEG